MEVPICDSSLVTYSASCSSLKPRSRVSFNFLISSEARSTAGTVTSVTRNTIQSPPAAPGACAGVSFAERKAASVALAGSPATLIFHLVVKARDLAAGALGCDLALQLRRDAFVSRLNAGLDLADLDQYRSEPPLHRLTYLAGRHRKCRVGNRGVDHCGFGDG